jgi:hypothetical protein
MIKSPLLISLLLYAIIVGILIYTRPDFLFLNNKKFGVKNEKDNTTLLPLWIVLILIAIIVYAISITISFSKR